MNTANFFIQYLCHTVQSDVGLLAFSAQYILPRFQFSTSFSGYLLQHMLDTDYTISFRIIMNCHDKVKHSNETANCQVASLHLRYDGMYMTKRKNSI